MFASPDIVVPTVNPRKPRQASNRIRVRRHGMRIKFWIFLGNVKMKLRWVSEGKKMIPDCAVMRFCISVVDLQNYAVRVFVTDAVTGQPCNSTMLDGIVYGPTKFDSRYPFRIKIKYILQFCFYAFMPRFADCLKVILEHEQTDGVTDKRRDMTTFIAEYKSKI
jgi:hypothetical protein